MWRPPYATSYVVLIVGGLESARVHTDYAFYQH